MFARHVSAFRRSLHGTRSIAITATYIALVCLSTIGLTKAWAEQYGNGGSQSSLSVTVITQAPQGSRVWLSLFDEDKFLAQALQTLSAETDSQGFAKFSIADLAAGTFALSAFLDVDGDDALSTNFFGIPNEPVGFSNDAKARFGPPDFAEAAFVFPENTHQEINLTSVAD